MSFWSSGFWIDGFWSDEFWGAEAPVAEVAPDGARPRRRRKPKAVKPLYRYRTQEDIRREQLEDERYLASLEKPQQAPAPEKRETEPAIDQATTPAALPILAGVAARAASAVQAKLEEARQAAASVRLADEKRRRTLALLLALD